MGEAIYFTKVEFRKYCAGKYIMTILLNIPEQELSYQVPKITEPMPAIQKEESLDWDNGR